MRSATEKLRSHFQSSSSPAPPHPPSSPSSAHPSQPSKAKDQNSRSAKNDVEIGALVLVVLADAAPAVTERNSYLNGRPRKVPESLRDDNANCDLDVEPRMLRSLSCLQMHSSSPSSSSSRPIPIPVLFVLRLLGIMFLFALK